MYRSAQSGSTLHTEPYMAPISSSMMAVYSGNGSSAARSVVLQHGLRPEVPMRARHQNTPATHHTIPESIFRSQTLLADSQVAGGDCSNCIILLSSSVRLTQSPQQDSETVNPHRSWRLHR